MFNTFIKIVLIIGWFSYSAFANLTAPDYKEIKEYLRIFFSDDSLSEKDLEQSMLAVKEFERFQQRRKNIFGTGDETGTRVDEALTNIDFGPSDGGNYIPTAISKIDAEKSFIHYGARVIMGGGHRGKEVVDIIVQAINSAIDLMSYSRSENIHKPNQAISAALEKDFTPLKNMGVMINKGLVNQQFNKYRQQGLKGRHYQLLAILEAIAKNYPRVKGHYNAHQYAISKDSFYKQWEDDVAESNHYLALGIEKSPMIRDYYEKGTEYYNKKSMELQNMSEAELQRIFNFDKK